MRMLLLLRFVGCSAWLRLFSLPSVKSQSCASFHSLHAIICNILRHNCTHTFNLSITPSKRYSQSSLIAHFYYVYWILCDAHSNTYFSHICRASMVYNKCTCYQEWIHKRLNGRDTITHALDPEPNGKARNHFLDGNIKIWMNGKKIFLGGFNLTVE